MKTKVVNNGRMQIANWIKPNYGEWVSEYKANTGKGVGEILDEAIEALKQRTPVSKKLNF